MSRPWEVIKATGDKMDRLTVYAPARGGYWLVMFPDMPPGDGPPIPPFTVEVSLSSDATDEQILTAWRALRARFEEEQRRVSN